MIEGNLGEWEGRGRGGQGDKRSVSLVKNYKLLVMILIIYRLKRYKLELEGRNI
jgi:hypothetical protein